MSLLQIVQEQRAQSYMGLPKALLVKGAHAGGLDQQG